MVAANRNKGGIAAFARLPSQERLIRGMEDCIEACSLATHQLSPRELEAMLGLGFAGVLHGADTTKEAGQEMRPAPNPGPLRVQTR